MKSSWWCRNVVLAIATLVATAGATPDAPRIARRSSSKARRHVRRRWRSGPAGAAHPASCASAPPPSASCCAPAAAPRAALVLNLFPDVALTIARERLETGRWRAHLLGRPRRGRRPEHGRRSPGTASLLSGGIVTGGRAFDLVPTGDGTGRRRPSALSTRRRSSCPRPTPPAARAAGAYVQDLAADGSTAAIDLLVLYTPAARARVGGTAQIESQLANAVAVTNTAFQRSGVNAVLTAVGLREIAYTEAHRPQRRPDGDQQRRRRLPDHRGAAQRHRRRPGRPRHRSVVHVRTAAASPGSGRRAPTAFSVTEQACLYAGQWSFSHELGHNFGARHAPGDSSDTTPACATYACGYRDGGRPHVDGVLPGRLALVARAQLLERDGPRAGGHRRAHRQLAPGQRPAPQRDGGQRGHVPNRRCRRRHCPACRAS